MKKKKYGIPDISKADYSRDIAICNNCDTYYYDDLREINPEQCLCLLEDPCEEEDCIEKILFYKGCHICKTDGYLADYHIITFDPNDGCLPPDHSLGHQS